MSLPTVVCSQTLDGELELISNQAIAICEGCMKYISRLFSERRHGQLAKNVRKRDDNYFCSWTPLVGIGP
jgi:hypothetical protein